MTYAYRGLFLGFAAILGGCLQQVDLSELQFASEDTGLFREADSSAAAAHCYDYLLCVVEGTVDCVLPEEALERSEAEAFSACADMYCPADGLSAAFPSVADCVLVTCAASTVACATMVGEDSCTPFAQLWKDLDSGNQTCPQGSDGLCLLESLTDISPSNVNATTSLIGCLALVKQGFQDFALDCLPYCQ